jgi:hypothetical protein
MAEVAYQGESIVMARRTDWGAIWAGVFSFVAIWSVFGVLGFAIFTSVANPAAAQPVTGMGVGLGIWAVILTIIAMYVAGRETGRLAAVPNRHERLIHGMIMFGLSVVAVLVVTALGGIAFPGNATATGGVHSSYVLGLFAGMGWIGFASLFLGWLAAMGGASMAAPRIQQERISQQVRPAA